MVDKKQLRAGNLLMHGNRIVEVEEIGDDGINICGTKEITIWNYDYNNLFPIDITPEWLERFGFIKQNNAWHINKPLSYTEAYFSLFDNNLCKGNLDLQLNGSYYMLLPRIKYVHQLQNIYYFLSGEELTIKTD